LLAVGWSSCFLSAIKIVAHQMKVKLTDLSVDAEVDLGSIGDKYFLQARLNVNLPGLDRDIAKQIVDSAHLVCPYSKATHGNIDVATTINT
jgi:Ohr subfamily peroxiredoxin